MALCNELAVLERHAAKQQGVGVRSLFPAKVGGKALVPVQRRDVDVKHGLANLIVKKMIQRLSGLNAADVCRIWLEDLSAHRAMP